MKGNLDKQLSKIMTSLSKEVDVIPSLYKNVSDSEAPKRRARSEE